LKKVLAAGGVPIILCDAPSLRGGTWDAEGNIIAALDIRSGLSLVPGAGGAPKQYTTLSGNETTHRWPQALPGGAGVLFISSTTPGGYESAVIEFASPKGERKVVHRGGYAPRYAATGDLLFMSQGNLFAAPLNLARMELTRSQAPVLYDADGVPFSGLAPLALSANGMLLYRRGAGAQKTSLAWVDRAGKIDRLPLKAANYRSFALSPNGKQIIITESGDGPTSIYDIDRDVLTRLQIRGGRMMWTPDGRQLVFGNAEGLSLASADGSGSPRLLTKSGGDLPMGWLPDGSVLYFLRNSQLWRLPMNGSGGGIPKPAPPERVEGVVAVGNMTVSPDGRWAAGERAVPGSIEAIVYSLAPGVARQWQVSADGGYAPNWSPRGNELFYARADGQLAIVPYSVQGGTFVPGKPERWSVPQLAEAHLNGRTAPRLR